MRIRSLSLFVMLALAVALAVGSAGCPKKPPKTTPTPTPEETTATPTPTPDENAMMHGSPTPTPDETAGGCDNAVIRFDLDSSTITGENVSIAKAAAACLNDHRDWKVTVGGHADERGSTQYNLALGERRARAVADYLVNAGVDKSRVDSVSFGEEKPVAHGHDESAWSQNRRAELKVTH